MRISVTNTPCIYRLLCKLLRREFLMKALCKAISNPSTIGSMCRKCRSLRIECLVMHRCISVCKTSSIHHSILSIGSTSDTAYNTSQHCLKYVICKVHGYIFKRIRKRQGDVKSPAPEMMILFRFLKISAPHVHQY